MNTVVYSKNELILFLISCVPIIEMIISANVINLQTKRFNLREHKYLLGLLGLLNIYFTCLFLCRLRISEYHKDTRMFYLIVTIVIMFVILIPIPILDSWNVILMMVSKNPSMNISKKEYFPYSAELEVNFIFLQKEVLDIVEKYKLDCIEDSLPTTNYLSNKKNLNGKDSCWRFSLLKKGGKMNNDLLQNYPYLKKYLQNDDISNVAISIIDPNISIPPHTGYFKGYLRYHLCIETSQIEPKPYIICGGVKHEWRTGEGVLFDDMFEHQVVNNSKSRRIVLFLDIKRRSLPFPFQTINDILCNLIDNNPLYKLLLKNQHVQVKNIV